MTAPAWLAEAAGPAAGAWLAAAAALGACLGSFLNVVIHRLPRGESLLRPGSHCPRCGAAVRPWHNVPVLGWLLLRGRCRDCAAPIPVRYPLVELAGAAAVLAAVATASDPLGAALRAALLLALTAVFFIDLDHRLILDVMTLPGTLLGVAAAPWLGLTRLDAVVGAAIGWGALQGLRTAWKRMRGVEGLGGGDVKFAMWMGAWLGWQGVALTFVLGSLVGAAVGLWLMGRGRADGATTLPYGVFLAPAAAVVAVAGPGIWSWYLALAA